MKKLSLFIDMDFFWTSIPSAEFPGIGASIRMDFASRLSAISSASLTMLLTLTPTAG